MTMFQKATKKQAKLRLAVIGASGSGKTYTALSIACGMVDKVAVIDTEHGSASKYSNIFSFDVCNLESFAPSTYVSAIKAAEKEGYEAIVIDSLSHAWSGKGGVMEMLDNAKAKQRTQNSFTAWGDVTPEHNKLIDAMLQCKAHLFVTMRAKTEYVQEKDTNGKTIIRKVGLAPVQRDGMEYEFDIVGDIDQDHTLVVTKSRCPEVDGEVIKKPGQEFADSLKKWVSDGASYPDSTSSEQGKSLANAGLITDDQRNRIAQLLMSDLIKKEEADKVSAKLSSFTFDRANGAIEWLEELITERSQEPTTQ